MAELGNQPGGGATRRVDNHEMAPETGIYVSTETPEVIGDAPVSPRVVHLHQQLIERAHARPSYQGIWNSGSAEKGTQGPVYIDHSRRYLSPRLAHFVAGANGQVALFDATAGKVRDTDDPATAAWAEKAPRPKR